MQNDEPLYIPNVNELLEERPRGYVLSVIRADLPNAINAGLNQTQAFRAYVDAGLGPNKNAFQALYNEVKAQMTSSHISGQQQAFEVPLTSDSLDWDRSTLAGKSNYRYKEVFDAAVYDNNTGEIRNQVLAYYHNEPMSIAELQAEALAYFQGESVGTSSERVVLSASLSETFINRNFVSDVEK